MAMPNSMQTYSQPKYTDCCLPLPPWDAHAGICQEEEIKYKWAWLLNERNFSSNTGHHTRMRLNPEYSHLYIYHLINHFFHEILFPLPPPILTLDFCLNTWSQSCFNVIFRRVKTLSYSVPWVVASLLFLTVESKFSPPPHPKPFQIHSIVIMISFNSIVERDAILSVHIYHIFYLQLCYQLIIYSEMILFSPLLFYRNIIALQCCVSFCYTMKWISHMHTYILSLRVVALDFSIWKVIRFVEKSSTEKS